MRNRGSVVLLENNQVVLIRRRVDKLEYYVFPGGGIEVNETPEEAAKREALEELGVVVSITSCLGILSYHGDQYFFLARIVSGRFGTGMGEEFCNKTTGRGTYHPVWIDIPQLMNIDVKPKEMAELLIEKCNELHV
ncbi:MULTISPECIES: NUDIX domain-containing protein [unclassified Virgibacillus]|uniref:NUDIX hydrolase n=1 Tax=unclassified Virgibacillus TaxID=2620237 RepID=UPI000EF441BB|nr:MULTISPECIES: NUDIX domain-containing protein [unclassified Virgibacillus]MDY7045487.1 NUDIX domain-containing protein [Virgibacillus sp. M23]